MKKITSVLLLSLFLISLLPAGSVFAAAPVAKDIKFRDAAGNGCTMNQEGYNGSTAAINLVETTSETKNCAVQFTNSGSDNANLGNLELTESNTLVTTMRVKLLGGPGASDFAFRMTANSYYGYQWEFAADSTGENYVFKNQATFGSNAVLEKDTWYNIMTVFEGMYSYSYVFEEKSGTQIGFKYTQVADTVANAITKSPQIWAKNTSSEGVLLDDYKYYVVDNNTTFSMIGAENTENISLDDAVTLKFDQPVGGTKSTHAVTADMFTVAGATVSSVAVKNFNTVEVKFSGLTAGKTYELDYSGVKSGGGKALSDEIKVISFTTAAKKLFTEDFETVPTSGSFAKIGSEIFNSDTGTNVFETVEEGRTGKAIKFKSLEYTPSGATESTYRQAYMITADFGNVFKLSQNKSLVFNMSFMVIEEPDTTSAFQTEVYYDGSNIGLYIKRDAGERGFYIISGAQESPIEAGRWYNLSVAVKANSDGTAYTTTTTVHDDVTGKRLTMSVCSLGSASKTITIRANTGQLNGDQTVAFDDAAVYMTENTDTMSLLSKSESVNTDGTVKLEFDNPVTPAAEMFEIEGAEIGDIKVKDYNTAIISFTGLEFLTDYTLDFSKVTSSGGAALSGSNNTIDFTTEADKVHDLTLIGEAVLNAGDDGAIDANDTLTFTLYSKKIVTPVIIAAFYEQGYPLKLEGVEIFTDKALTAGYNDVELTLKKAHADAKTIKLFAWNGFSDVKPLMNEVEVAFP